MAKVTGTAHTSFTVVDLDSSLKFWVDIMGGRLLSQVTAEGDTLGTSIRGKDAAPFASLKIGIVEIGGHQVEFFQFLSPSMQTSYHGDPSIVGSSHLALKVDDLQEMYDSLLEKGVVFNSKVNENITDGRVTLKWVYLRDPDNICVELMQDC